MRIAMVGAGYVGLVTGACLTEFGTDAVCVDRDAERIERLRRGEMPIYEPGLADLVARNVEAGRLTFSTDLAAAVAGADIVFIAVGTPSRRGDGHADLSFVFEAAREVVAAARGYTVLVTKSTVPVGTGARVAGIAAELRPDAEIDVVSNPEFLREGAAIEDFMHPDRVVIGAETDRARAAMRELYRPLFLRETPILFTDRETAELTKYAANAFLAVKITFINEIADLCERVGADVQDVARGMGLDRRIGDKFLHPGPGYGGSCFPKDTLALTRTASDAARRCGWWKRPPPSTTPASAPWPGACWRRSAAMRRAGPSPCSASPSSPTRTTCARRRAWSWCRRCRRPGRRCAPTTRRRWKPPGRCCRMSPGAAMSMTPPRAPTAPCC